MSLVLTGTPRRVVVLTDPSESSRGRKEPFLHLRTLRVRSGGRFVGEPQADPQGYFQGRAGGAGAGGVSHPGRAAVAGRPSAPRGIFRARTASLGATSLNGAPTGPPRATSSKQRRRGLPVGRDALWVGSGRALPAGPPRARTPPLCPDVEVRVRPAGISGIAFHPSRRRGQSVSGSIYFSSHRRPETGVTERDSEAKGYVRGRPERNSQRKKPHS